MENIHCVVRSPATGQRSVADETWVTHTSHIDAVSLKIVGAPEFACFLSYAIDGSRVHNSFLRGILRGVRAKSGNGARPEQLVNLEFPANLQTVVESLHIDILSLERIDLASSRQQRRQTVDLTNIILSHNRLNSL